MALSSRRSFSGDWGELFGLGRRSATSAAARSLPARATARAGASGPTPAAPPPKPKRAKPVPPLEAVRAFVRTAEASAKRVLVAIDPGQTGAIAFRCGDAYAVVDIPVTVTKRKKTRRTSKKERRATGKKTKTVDAEHREFDLPAVVALFALLKPVRGRVHALVEKVPVTLGPGRLYADVMLNRAYAMWPLFLLARGYRLYEEPPDAWKAALKIPKGATKEDCRKLAAGMFPAADIPLVKHHNRAEALLLTEHLDRKLRGRTPP